MSKDKSKMPSDIAMLFSKFFLRAMLLANKPSRLTSFHQKNNL